MLDRRYKVGEDFYTIPEGEIQGFLTEFPDAVEVESYTVGEDSYSIPVNETEGFLAEFPDAQPTFENGVKKKEKAGVTTSPESETYGGETPSTDKYGFQWGGVDLEAPTELITPSYQTTAPDLEVLAASDEKAKIKKEEKLQEEIVKANEAFRAHPSLLTKTEEERYEAVERIAKDEGISEESVMTALDAFDFEQATELGQEIQQEEFESAKKGLSPQIGESAAARQARKEGYVEELSDDEVKKVLFDKRIEKSIAGMNEVDRKIYRLNLKLQKLAKKEDKTDEDRVDIQDIKDEIIQIQQDKSLLYSNEKSGLLWDPKTENLTDQPTASAVNYDKAVDAQADNLQKNFRDQLGEVYEQSYLRFQAADRLYNEKTEVASGYTEKKEVSYKDMLGQYSPGVSGDIISVGLSKGQQEAARRKELWIQAKFDFDSATRAFLLNEDPGHVEESWWSIAGTTLLRNLPILPDFFPEGIVPMTDEDYIKTYQGFSSRAGLQITEEQEEKFKSDLREKVAEGVGGFGAIIPELAFYAATIEAGSGIIGLTSLLARWGKPIAEGGKRINQFYKFMVQATLEEVKTQAAGLEPGAGFGFKLAGLLKMGKLKIGGKYGYIFAKYANTVAQATVGGTTGMQMAAVMESTWEMARHDKDFMDEIHKRFGETMGEAGEKILVDAIVMAMFGGFSATKAVPKDIAEIRAQAKIQREKGNTDAADVIEDYADKKEAATWKPTRKGDDPSFKQKQELTIEGKATAPKREGRALPKKPKGETKTPPPFEGTYTRKPKEKPVAEEKPPTQEDVDTLDAEIDMMKVEAQNAEAEGRTEEAGFIRKNILDKEAKLIEITTKVEDVQAVVDLENQKPVDIEGTEVDYGGIVGTVKRTKEGVVVVDAEGESHLIEGGMSGKTASELGITVTTTPRLTAKKGERQAKQVLEERPTEDIERAKPEEEPGAEPTAEVKPPEAEKAVEVFLIDGKKVTTEKAIKEVQQNQWVNYDPSTKPIIYKGSNPERISMVEEHNDKLNPKKQNGDYKNDFKKELFSEALDKKGARSFAHFIRKHIDPSFRQDVLVEGSGRNITFEEHISYIIEEYQKRNISNEKIEAFAKDVGIEIPKPKTEKPVEEKATRKNELTNDEGKPIIFYHGTTKENAIIIQKKGFDSSKGRFGTTSFSLMQDVKYAKPYDKGGIIKTTVSLKNPMSFEENFRLREKINQEVAGKPMSEMTTQDWITHTNEINRRFVEKAKKLGYDGVYEPGQSEITVFDSKNIHVIKAEKPKSEESSVPIKVKMFAKDGHTKGIFKGEDGKLYKSSETGDQFGREGGLKTSEHSLLSENQDINHLIKVGKVVETSEGKAFEVEELSVIKEGDLSYEDYVKVEKALHELNDRGIEYNDNAVVMRRANGDAVLIDLSNSKKTDKKVERESLGFKAEELLSPEAKSRVEAERAQDHYSEMQKAFGERENKENTYILTQRPPSIGTHPSKGLIGTPKEIKYNNRTAWELKYDKPLSDKDVERFELAKSVGASEIGGMYLASTVGGREMRAVITDVAGGRVKVTEFFNGKTKELDMTEKGFDQYLKKRDWTKAEKPVTEAKEITPEQVHKAAKEAGMEWDSEKEGSKEFMDLSEEVTGERHIDAMSSAQRSKLIDAIKARETKEAEKPVAEAPKEKAPTLFDVKEATKKTEKQLGTKSERERRIKITEVDKDTDLFQNREEEYSQKTVDSIVNEAREGTFNEGALDPIRVWKNPKDGKTYILAGHSRVEAYRRLAAEGRTEFENIPAIEMKDMTLEQAKEFATVKSNMLGAQETMVARSNIYRKMRDEGKSEAAILEAAQKTEGRNAVAVVNLSALNPKGKAIETIREFEDSPDITTRSKVNSIADWIGGVRKRNKDLANTHENEIFDFLMDAYSTTKGAGKVTNKYEFDQMMEVVVARARKQGKITEDTPLNVKNAIGKSPIEIEYDAELTEAQGKSAEAKKALEEKRADLMEKGATKEQMDEGMKGYEDRLRLALAEEKLLREQKGLVKEAAKQQTSLFDELTTQKRTTDEVIREFTESTERIAKDEAAIKAIEGKAKDGENLSSKELKEQIEKADEVIGDKKAEKPAKPTTEEERKKADNDFIDGLDEFLGATGIGPKKVMSSRERNDAIRGLKKMAKALVDKGVIEAKEIIRRIKAAIEKEYHAFIDENQATILSVTKPPSPTITSKQYYDFAEKMARLGVRSAERRTRKETDEMRDEVLSFAKENSKELQKVSGRSVHALMRKISNVRSNKPKALEAAIEYINKIATGQLEKERLQAIDNIKSKVDKELGKATKTVKGKGIKAKAHAQEGIDTLNAIKEATELDQKQAEAKASKIEARIASEETQKSQDITDEQKNEIEYNIIRLQKEAEYIDMFSNLEGKSKEQADFINERLDLEISGLKEDLKAKRQEMSDKWKAKRDALIEGAKEPTEKELQEEPKRPGAVAGYLAMQLNPKGLLTQMFGKAGERIAKTFETGTEKAVSISKEMQQQVKKTVGRLFESELKLQKALSKKMKITLVEEVKDKEGNIVEEKEVTKNVKISNLAHLWASYKSEANYEYTQRIADVGRRLKLTPDEWLKLDEMLPDNVKKFADWIVQDFLPSHHEPANKVYYERNLVNLPKLPDYLFVNAKKISDATVALTDINRVSTHKPFTINRVSGEYDLWRNDIYSGLLKHIDQHSKFVGLSKPIGEANSLINSKNVSRLIDQKGLSPYKRSLEHMMGIGMSGDKKIGIDWLYHNFIGSKVLMNMSLFGKQLASFFTVFDPRYASTGEILKSIVNISTSKQAWQRAVGILRQSGQFSTRNIKEIETHIKNNEPRKAQLIIDEVARKMGNNNMAKSIKAVGEFIWNPTQKGDRFTIRLGGLPLIDAVYRTELKRLIKEDGVRKEDAEKMASEEALYKFNEWMNDTQQSMQWTGKSQFQTGNWKYAAPFMNAPMAYSRKILTSYRDGYRGAKEYRQKLLEEGVNPHVATIRSLKGVKKADIQRIILYQMALPVIWSAITTGGRSLINLFSEDEEKRIPAWRDFGYDTTLAWTKGLYGIGFVTNFMYRYGADKAYGRQADNFVRIFDDVTNMGTALMDAVGATVKLDELDEEYEEQKERVVKGWFKFGEGITAIMGLPQVAVNRISGVMTDETYDTSLKKLLRLYGMRRDNIEEWFEYELEPESGESKDKYIKRRSVSGDNKKKADKIKKIKDPTERENEQKALTKKIGLEYDVYKDKDDRVAYFYDSLKNKKNKEKVKYLTEEFEATKDNTVGVNNKGNKLFSKLDELGLISDPLWRLYQEKTNQDF